MSILTDCLFENDDSDPLLWGTPGSDCPWGTDAVDCGGVNYSVWVTAIKYLRVIRTVLAADDGQDAARAASGDQDWRCSTNLDAVIGGWIRPALTVLTPATGVHDESEHAAALEEELLLVAGVEAGLDSAIAEACRSVTDARVATGFYSPDASTLSSEPPTLVPAAILARVRGVCPGATAASARSLDA